MDDFDEIYAACIIEYARRFEGGVLTGPFYVIGKDARDSFNLPYNQQVFDDALAILEEMKVLTTYRREGMQTYYRIEAEKFESAMTKVGLGVRGYQLGGNTVEEREYNFLESFNDVGPQYLQDALETYESYLVKIAGEDDVSEDEFSTDDGVGVDSRSWTGLPADFELSEDRRAVLVRELEKIDLALQNAELGQYDKAQARALVLGAKALAEGPDPQVDLIWEMIGRANKLAGVASFLVSLITLFMTAAK